MTLTIKQVYEAVAAELNTLGHTAEVRERSWEVEVEGERKETRYAWDLVVDEILIPSYHLKLKATYTKGSGRFSYGSRSTGKQCLVIGSYGSRVTLPQRADGQFKWESAAHTVHCYVEGEKARKVRDQTAAANREAVEALRTRLGLSTYDSLIANNEQSSEKPIRVKVDFTGTYSPADAEALILALRKLGVVKEARA